MMRMLYVCLAAVSLACLAAVSLAQTTAVRPAQIIGGTPNVTVNTVTNTSCPGGCVSIGTTVPWRTDATASPSFTTADLAKTVELTFNGAILANIPDATGGYGDGAGFTIQVGPGTLNLQRQVGGASTISGFTGISVGSWQSATLVSRGGNWYASISVTPTFAAGPGGAAWNPSDKDASIVLSTTTVSNDTATESTSAGAYKAVRATTPTFAQGTAHKAVVSFSITSASGNGGGTVVGVMGSAATLSGYPGSSSPGFGVNGGNGGDFLNGGAANINTGCTGDSRLNYTTGATVWLAIDFSTGNVWCSLNCTTWFFSGSPAAGTGFAATLTAGTYYLGWGGGNLSSGTDKGVLNASPSLTSCTGLTGFSPWNSA